MFSPWVRILTLLTVVGVAVGCSDTLQTPEGPEETAQASNQQSISPSVPDSIVDRAVERFEATLKIDGQVAPNVPLHARISARTLLPTKSARLTLVAPELEAARQSEFGPAFRVPVGEKIPSFSSQQISALGRGSSHQLAGTFRIPAPGYYRIVGQIRQGSDDRLFYGGEPVVAAATVEKWVYVTPSGGQITDEFYSSIMPDSVKKQPGPFRYIAREAFDLPEDETAGRVETASLLSSVKAAVMSAAAATARLLGLESAAMAQGVTIELEYYNGHTQQYEPLTHTMAIETYTDYSDYYDPDDVELRSRRGPSNTYTAGCPDQYESQHDVNFYARGWNVTMADDGGSRFLAGTIITHDQCYNGIYSEQLIAPDSKHARAYVELNKSVTGAENSFGRSRDSIYTRITPNALNSAYYPPGDTIVLRESHIEDETAIFVTAHEYGHAFDHKALNGLHGGGCPSPHYLDGSHNEGCAYSEGFANYVGAWTRRDLSPTEYGFPREIEADTLYYPGDPSHGTGDPDNGLLIEGAVASYLYDLTDASSGAHSMNESFDNQSLPGSYLADVWATCKVQYSGQFLLPADDIAELTLCLEDRVTSPIYDDSFPTGTAPIQQSHTASKPGSWSRAAIVDIWAEDLLGNW